MTNLAIIGGTGLTSLVGLEVTRRERVSTPYGEPSGPVVCGQFAGTQVMFLGRHGSTGAIPAHRINYCANVWALKKLGATRIIAVAAVGGIRHDIQPGSIVFPDQIIDYTHDRKHTYFDDGNSPQLHADFTHPYDHALRQSLLSAASARELLYVAGGTYGAVQGPRLETAAEILRMERDGCDMVGMTGMPEAALARELNLAYACCAVVANWAAGKSLNPIHQDIGAHLARGIEQVSQLLQELVAPFERDEVGRV